VFFIFDLSTILCFSRISSLYYAKFIKKINLFFLQKFAFAQENVVFPITMFLPKTEYLYAKVETFFNTGVENIQ